MLIAEEYDSHRCNPRINGKIVKIEVDYFITGKHPKDGADMISAKALDGTVYWLVKRRYKPSEDKMPFESPSDGI